MKKLTEKSRADAAKLLFAFSTLALEWAEGAGAESIPDAFILSSRRHEATKLNPRKSSCAFALGGTPGESEEI